MDKELHGGAYLAVMRPLSATAGYYAALHIGDMGWYPHILLPAPHRIAVEAPRELAESSCLLRSTRTRRPPCARTSKQLGREPRPGEGQSRASLPAMEMGCTPPLVRERGRVPLPQSPSLHVAVPAAHAMPLARAAAHGPPPWVQLRRGARNEERSLREGAEGRQ